MTVDQEDRRRTATSPRLSWATARPFIEPVAPEIEHVRGAHPVPRRRRGRWTTQLLWRTVAVDAAVALVVAGGIWWSLPRAGAGALLLVAPSAMVLWTGLVAVLGGYQRRRLGAGPEEFQTVLRAGAVGAAALGTCAYLLQVEVPRRWLLVAIPALVALSMLGHHLLRRLLHRHRSAGRAMMRTLVVGRPNQCSAVAGDLRREYFHGYDVVGICTPHIDLDAEVQLSLDTLGTLSDIPQVVVDHHIDAVIVAGSEISGGALRRLSWALDRAGAQLIVVPDIVEVAGPHVTLRPVAGLSLLHIETPSRHLGRELGKKVVDVLLGTVLLVLAAPLIAVAAGVVRATSPGPAFYRQERGGVDGAPFTMWKLRSMVLDADQRRQGLEDRSDRDGLMFKMRADPRVTPVGRLLRRFSVDELPQLWNVVRGEMSLVGPRPPLMSEVVAYHDAVNRRLRVKPGLTGLWQVSGRADLSWEESVALDLRYVDNWSLAMDLLILWKTARVVLRGAGAY